MTARPSVPSRRLSRVRPTARAREMPWPHVRPLSQIQGRARDEPWLDPGPVSSRLIKAAATFGAIGRVVRGAVMPVPTSQPTDDVVRVDRTAGS
jgi:hypothetical protein